MDKAAQYAKAAELYKAALAEGGDADEIRAEYDAAVARIAAMPDAPQAAAPAAPAAKAPLTTSEKLTGGARALASGASFGFADEAEGAVRAALDPNVDYKTARDQVRDEQARFQSNVPWQANMGLEIAGGLATGGALRLAGKALLGRGATALGKSATDIIGRQASSLANSAWKQGALAGAGASESDNALGVAGGALFGGTAGAALGNVMGKVGGKAAEIMQRARGSETAKAIGRAGDAVQATVVPVLGQGGKMGQMADQALLKAGEFLSTVPQGSRAPTLAGRRAVTALANRMGNSKITPDVLALAGGANTAQGATIMDNMGVSGERTARGLRTLGGEAGEMIDDFTTKRARTYPDRMVDAVRNGKSIDNVVQTSKDFVEARKLASTPLYDQFRAQPPVADDPIIEKLLARPSMKAAMKQAVINERESGTPVQFMQITLANGKTKNVPVRTPAFLDAVKKAADGKIYTGKTVEGGIAPETLRAMRDTRSEFVDRLDNLYPMYKSARDAWAGPTALKSALNDGRDAMKGAIDPDEMADDLLKMGQSEREMYQRGAAAGIRDMLANGGLKPGSTEHRAFIDRVTNAFGKDADMVLTRIRDEVAATRTASNISGNSQTMDKGVDVASVVDELAPERSNIWSTFLYNPLRTTSNVVGKYVGGHIPLFRETRKETAKMLLSPADDAEVVKRIASEFVTKNAGKGVKDFVKGPLAAETAYGFFRRPPEERK